ncbi:MAG: small-conductance mechanosensitive channel [Maribacter sp.]|jgi:small-conductance mechanosensitive channel
MSDFFTKINDWLAYGWDIGNWAVTVKMLLIAAIIAIASFIIRRFIIGNILSFLGKRAVIDEGSRRKVQSIINIIVFLVATIGILKVLGLDHTFYDTTTANIDEEGNTKFGNFNIKISTFLFGFIIFKFAQLADWLIARILLDKYYDNKGEAGVLSDGKDDKAKTNKAIQYLVYILAITFALKWFNLDYGIDPMKDGGHFTISNTLGAITTVLIAWLAIWGLTNLILQPYYKRSNVDVGNQYAVNQLLKYLIYVLAIVFAFQNNLDFDLTLILGGAAALLVGIGLGLQQTFNDLISGIILLFERTIEVGDVVEVDGLVGTIIGIGIRTSIVRIRDNTSIIVPNSKFITDSVVNWTHNEAKQVRFIVAVGVAYGSDTELVKNTLLQVADDNPDVLQRPAPFVRFVDFADSSLNFELHFWSRNFIRIEDVKSDIRFQIDMDFRNQEIEIPFPQRVIWSANNEDATD